MLEVNSLYEITRMIQDTNGIKNDLNEAVELVGKLFQEKYISKFHNAIYSQQAKVEENPPREVQLMYALKPFISENKHPSIDKLIDMYLMMNTVQNIQNDFVDTYEYTGITQSTYEQDSSLHDDGVYDMDAACLASKHKEPLKSGNIAALMLIMTLTNKPLNRRMFG